MYRKALTKQGSNKGGCKTTTYRYVGQKSTRNPKMAGREGY